MKYRIVEHRQNILGEIISSVMPVGFKPSMREGEPYFCTGNIDNEEEAQAKLKQRTEQLIRSGKINKVTVELEELYS